MADQVTPDKTPEEIEQAMFVTRESITEKVAALENQVAGTMQNVTETINGTVDAVKSLVSSAPEAVSDSVKQATAAVSDAVKDTFDISGHVRRHPWGAIGTSLLLGCITSWLVFRDRSNRGEMRPMTAPTPAPVPAPAAPVDTTPGLFDEILGMISVKVKELARSTIETATATVKENIESGVSQLVENAKEWTQTADHTGTNGTGGPSRRVPVGFGTE